MRISLIILLLLTLPVGLYAQQQPAYPRVMVYLSIAEPLGSLTTNGFTNNFSDGSTITFPTGVNLLKSDSFGLSFEISPAIRIEKGVAKTSSIVFHPGTMFRFKHGFTFITRAAFESNGRFGLTTVCNQVIARTPLCNYFIAAANPLRFGNGQPTSLGLNLQFGAAF